MSIYILLLCFTRKLLAISATLLWVATIHAADSPPPLLIHCEKPNKFSNRLRQEPSDIEKHRYKVIQSHPHNSHAFTQGLVYDNGVVYESTGRYGQSALLKMDLASGKTLAQHPLEKTLFGEGLTLFDNQLIQLSWKSGRVFHYETQQLKLLSESKIKGDGWGITHDGKHLISSDGSNQLVYRDPETLTAVKTLSVHYGKRPLKNLNELEWVNGCILANVWQTSSIAVIDPSTGSVTGMLDLSPLLQHAKKKSLSVNQSLSVDVANGIALIPHSGNLLVTGKYWPFIYQLKIIN